MRLNFHYPAADYLSNWVNYDKPFTDALGSHMNLDDTKTLECLNKAAANYGVARNFKSASDGTERLEPLRALLAQQTEAPKKAEVVSTVINFAQQLKKRCGKELRADHTFIPA